MASILPRSLQNLIQEFEKLPGVGPKTAARLAYHLLRAPNSESLALAKAAGELKKRVVTCQKCFNVSEDSVCPICSDLTRDQSVLCVVEEPLDVVAIEKTGGFKGLYHVLGGVISPVNGIGPEELRIKELLSNIKQNDQVKEVILGTNPNLEGEATAMYIARKIANMHRSIKISKLARGLPTGADLEYADNLTLKRSLEGRSDFS